MFALVFSPFIAAIWLYALGYNNKNKRNPVARAIALVVVGVAILLMLSATNGGCRVLGVCIGSAHAQQTVVRDAQGRTVGTVTTDSAGTKTFRDDSGRTTGTATRRQRRHDHVSRLARSHDGHRFRLIALFVLCHILGVAFLIGVPLYFWKWINL